MRVGILLEKFDPTAGGAATLSDTIIEDIKNIKTSYEFIVVYYGDKDTAYKSVEEDVLYINLNNIRFFRRIRSKFLKAREYIYSTIHNRIRDLSVGSLLNEIVKEEQIDLLWFTFPAVIPVSIPYIYTIWDLGNRKLPFSPEMNTTWNDWEYRERLCTSMAYRAAFVITGNESGKREILENYPMPESKIRVVPFPVSRFCDLEEMAPQFELPEKFFFYPAQYWPHKNHICIVKAIKILKEKYDYLAHVIFVGSDKGNRDYIVEAAKKYGVENQIIFAGFVSYPELKYLYTHAEAMIYASLLGPNNLPPIEAAYLGCPVIITNLEGHIEQMGEAALYFNGYSPEDLAEKIIRLSNSDLRKVIIKKEQRIRQSLSKYSYFDKVIKIINEFKVKRTCWNED